MIRGVHTISAVSSTRCQGGGERTRLVVMTASNFTCGVDSETRIDIFDVSVRAGTKMLRRLTGRGWRAHYVGEIPDSGGLRVVSVDGGHGAGSSTWLLRCRPLRSRWDVTTNLPVSSSSG